MMIQRMWSSSSIVAGSQKSEYYNSQSNKSYLELIAAQELVHGPVLHSGLPAANVSRLPVAASAAVDAAAAVGGREAAPPVGSTAGGAEDAVDAVPGGAERRHRERLRVGRVRVVGRSGDGFKESN